MALTRDRSTSYREGVEVELPVAANTKIYSGSMVCVNADGYAAPAANISGYRFMGVAMEQVDNSCGANGVLTVRLRRVGVFEFDAANLTQAQVGNAMYAVDDQTFGDFWLIKKINGYDDNVIYVPKAIRVGVLVKFVLTTKGWIDIAR